MGVFKRLGVRGGDLHLEQPVAHHHPPPAPVPLIGQWREVEGCHRPPFPSLGRSNFGLPRPKISETERVLQKSVIVHTAMAADHGGHGGWLHTCQYTKGVFTRCLQLKGPLWEPQLPHPATAQASWFLVPMVPGPGLEVRVLPALSPGRAPGLHTRDGQDDGEIWRSFWVWGYMGARQSGCG